ncbi:hypothetical protein DOK36_06440, partial [Campylobacter coli]|nr:hypothetical protein [Campylobacter coli]
MFHEKPRNFHYLVNIYFTIKKFKKGLKQVEMNINGDDYFTIKKFKKGLKLIGFYRFVGTDFTIKKFKKGL